MLFTESLLGFHRIFTLQDYNDSIENIIKPLISAPIPAGRDGERKKYIRNSEELYMDTRGISKLDLKRRNRKQILLSIRQAGMLARVDIAAQLSLTRAAVTIITNQMIAQNILEDMNGPIVENNNEPKRKGRKKTMIRINPDFRYVLGAVVNEREISIGLSDLAGAPIDNRFLEFNDDAKAEELVKFIVTSCRELMKKHSLSNKQILGLGVGIVPARWEMFRAENNNGMISFEKLCYLLEMELSLPVLAESAITLYALSSIDYSDAATFNQNLIVYGQKIHCATVIENELVGGFAADTSTVDRIVIVPNGTPCEGYPDGSVHAELTRAAVLAKVTAATGQAMTMEQVHDEFIAGNPAISQILEPAFADLARLIYNLCTGRNVRCATLQCFPVSERAKSALDSELLKLTGNENPILLRFSDVDGRNAFLAGCTLAVDKLFFETGGILPGDTTI